MLSPPAETVQLFSWPHPCITHWAMQEWSLSCPAGKEHPPTQGGFAARLHFHLKSDKL